MTSLSRTKGELPTLRSNKLMPRTIDVRTDWTREITIITDEFHLEYGLNIK
jgi:hypothetical protein